MSHEGVVLIERVLLVGFLIVVGATFRTLVGSSKRRLEIMLLGTLGGLTFGVLVASAISRWWNAESSGICAALGMVLGWCVAWCFARHVPGEN